jgi:hypothetical protein
MPGIAILSPSDLEAIRSRHRSNRKIAATETFDAALVHGILDDVDALIADNIRLRAALADAGQGAALVLQGAEAAVGQVLLARNGARS